MYFVYAFINITLRNDSEACKAPSEICDTRNVRNPCFSSKDSHWEKERLARAVDVAACHL